MVPKQREMDGIVRDIYQALETKDHLESTLFVVCGDHGMNDAGNHGASSPGETSAALLFMSPKMQQLGLSFRAPFEPKDEFEYYSKVEQSDIAPTIAALLGFPVSKNNLGAVIPDFLPFWSKTSDKVQILYRNARQILRIVMATFGPERFAAGHKPDPCGLEQEGVNELACEWLKITEQASSLAKADKMDSVWQDSMSTWLRRAQDMMSSMASNYDLPSMVQGQVCAVLAAVFSAIAVFVCFGTRSSSCLPLLLVTIPYAIMMFASSYVEEEHHFWYWSSTLWIAHLITKDVRR